MKTSLYFLISGVIFVFVIYILYIQGLAATKQIAAVLFVFRPGRNSGRASLNSCTGWVRHIGRFRESRTYTFTFESQLSKGEAEVLLLDGKKQELLRLNRHSASGTAALSKGQRYYLLWKFKSATGKCELHW